VYAKNGKGSSYPPTTQAGRDLFLEAARLIDAARR
jgi:hypothetical protein